MNLDDLYHDLATKVLSHIDDYELIFVDDGSQDQSFEILKKLSVTDLKIKIIKLSRNFGSHAAILAGLNACTGDCAVMKTADLQEPSDILLQMYDKWKQGNNVVLAIRTDRHDHVISKFFSNFYYWLMRRFVLKTMPKGGFDCFLIDRKVIEVIRLMDEKNTSLMGQILWAGFKSDAVYYTRLKRTKGKSRWTIQKKIKLVIDSVLSFTYLPIRFMSVIGLTIFISSLFWSAYIIYQRVYGGIQLEGWTTLMVFNLFSSGLVLLMLGIIGEYLWRNFDATRSRPVYIIEESNIDHNEKE